VNISASRKRSSGLTLIEVLAVIVALMILAALLMPVVDHSAARAPRLQCVNNLKQIGLGYRIWPSGQTAKFTFQESVTNGGTMEFTSGPNAFRHFLIMSNELVTPKVLFCPAETDRARIRATTFSFAPNPGEIPFASNPNLSYFVGIDAADINPQSILSGDHNITNGTPIKNGILELNTNSPAGWTAELHNQVGNVALADGSVQQLSNTGLRAAVTNTGMFTNRLQMPVLTP